MTAVEMGAAMGTFVDSRVNFVTGSAMMEQNRAELYVDDQVPRVNVFVCFCCCCCCCSFCFCFLGVRFVDYRTVCAVLTVTER